ILDSGFIHSIGVSNFESRHIDQLWNVVKYRPVVNQCEFHPHLTRPELVEYCRNKGILFQAHTPLAGHSKSLLGDPVILSIADKYKVDVSQIILSFAHIQGIGIIPKSGNVSRIKSNISFLGLKLTEEEIASMKSLNKNKRYSDCDGWNVM
ncbi:Aldo_ket_red domain-containing protein, partial [Meloidogyne graminicola]